MGGMRILAAVAACVLASGSAQAEVLEVTGEFPAAHREASFLRSLSIDRFSGQDGATLQITIERALQDSGFELMGGRAGRDSAEGAMSGGISAGVDERPFLQKEKRCTSKDDKGKCIKEEQVELTCRRRTIDIAADVRIVRNTDGRILYSVPKPFREEVTWCPGGNPGRTAEDVVSSAIREIASSVRDDIVSNVSTYKIRVRESTKGLAKDAAKRFKDFVKLTKRDARGACAGWEAMRQEAPGHPSLLFNLGLCAEARGDFEGALAIYRDAAQAGANEGREGADRASRLIAGREDAVERKRRRG